MEPTYLKAILRRAQASETLEKYEDALNGMCVKSCNVHVFNSHKFQLLPVVFVFPLHVDYKKALEIDPTQSTARQAVMYLPDKVKEQNEKLKDEMLGTLN